jgi:hypothetical protein
MEVFSGLKDRRTTLQITIRLGRETQHGSSQRDRPKL